MATFYADKAYATQQGGGNVLPIDTGGRVRIAYDQLTIGSVDIPNPVPAGSVIYFCGAGIPKGARVLMALLVWGDIVGTPNGSTLALSMLSASGSGSILFTSELASLTSSTDDNPSLAVLAPTATGDANAPLVSSSREFPVLTTAVGELDSAGDISVTVYYTLD